MARARNIKPGLFKNEILGVADPLYTLLFEGLWVLADRDGRLEDRPLRIKAEIFPYRDRLSVAPMLDWLQAQGFIVRYGVGELRCIEICNFQKHQNPHKNETESDLPGPEARDDEPVDGCLEYDCIGTTSENIGSTRADSLSSDSLIPDSLFTDPPSSAGRAVALTVVPKAKPAASTSPTAETWQAYAAAYRQRYSVDPVRNATVNGQLSNFVKRIGADEAPAVAAFYVRHNARYYVGTMHGTAALLKDAEKLRTEWATGMQMTAARADQSDKTQTNSEVFNGMIREALNAQQA